MENDNFLNKLSYEKRSSFEFNYDVDQLTNKVFNTCEDTIMVRDEYRLKST